MRVGELIGLLSAYPLDAEVERFDDVYEVGTDIVIVEYQPERKALRLGGVLFSPEPARVVIH